MILKTPRNIDEFQTNDSKRPSIIIVDDNNATIRNSVLDERVRFGIGETGSSTFCFSSLPARRHFSTMNSVSTHIEHMETVFSSVSTRKLADALPPATIILLEWPGDSRCAHLCTCLYTGSVPLSPFGVGYFPTDPFSC